MTEVARQEQLNCTEKGDIFDTPENGPESRVGVDNTIACIVRRARRFVTAKCTDCDGNPPKRVGTSKKRSREAYLRSHSSNESTAAVRVELENIFADAGHSDVEDSEFKRPRISDCHRDHGKSIEVFDNFPYFVEHSDGESGNKTESSGTNSVTCSITPESNLSDGSEE